MITPSFSPTATERVLPKLALDFTTASLDSRVTFTRTTGVSNPATYVNSTGYVTSATNNQPRFDYDPVTLACKGLLIEESRINYTLWSQDFSNAVWTQSGVSVVTNSGIAPNNILEACKIIPSTASTNYKELQQNFSHTSGVTYTFAGYVKASGYRYVQLIGNGNSFGTFNVNYDLLTGTETQFNAGTSTVVNRSIVSAGNGWYRISVSVTALATTGGRIGVDIIPDATSARGTTWAGDGTSGVLFWAFQTEAGSFPTSYIPTTTTALTRNADVATMTGTNFSSWFNASEGTVYAKADCYTTTPSPTRQTVTFNKISGAAGYMSLKIPRPSAATGFTVVNDANTVSCDLAGQTITANTQISIVGSYKTDNFAFSDRGVSIATDVSGAVPTSIDRFCIGSDLLTYQNGHIQKIMYWPMRLTNAEVQSFSKS